MVKTYKRSENFRSEGMKMVRVSYFLGGVFIIKFPVYMLNRRRLSGYLSLNIATQLYEFELAFNIDEYQDED
jgi:hypothetical protein